MKRIFSIALTSLAILAASCDKYDDSALKEAISSLEDRVTALEKLNDEVAALKAIVEGKLMVSSVVEEDGVYTVTLSDGTTVKVNSGMTELPVVTVITENGRNYWGYYKAGKVEQLLYNGKKVEVTALTPAIKVNDSNRLEISVDGGRTWTESETTLSGGLFSKVEQLEDCLIMTLADGFTEFRVPFVDDAQMLFFSVSGKQFFTNGQTKTIPVEMVGVENYTITERPEGWKASLSDGMLSVTAPAKGVGETSGIIKMLGIGDEPKIAQVYVTIGTAPTLLSIDQQMNVTIKPNPQTCFYGAVPYEEFDAKQIAAEMSNVINPMMSRYPFASSATTMPLANLVGEVTLGQTYVVWVLPVTGGVCTETDVIYETVTSIGVTYQVSDVTFEDARLTVSIKGTDTYYLVPLENEMTLDNVIEDLNGNYADTYDRYRHSASYRGRLSDMIDIPMAGHQYEFLVLPVKHGAFCTSDAVNFTVTLAGYLRGGETSLTLEKSDVQYKSISAKVISQPASYKLFTAVVPEADYLTYGYADDDKLLEYLTSLPAVKYTDPHTYTATGLESGAKYWIVAAGLDRNGFVGSPARLEVSTKAVEYSSVTLTVGEVEATINSATIPVTASGEVHSYRYIFLSSSAGGYWYTSFIEDEQAAYDALIYGTVEYTDVLASEMSGGFSFKDLEFGTDYIFRIIGYDRDGKITNMGKVDFSPTVGNVVKSTDQNWIATRPNITSTITGTSIRLSVQFPQGCDSYILTRMSSEEYTAYMPSAARLRTDYVLGHSSALTFEENIVNYVPDWYISADRPYIVIAWVIGGIWYEPVVYDSATGTFLN